MLIQGKILSFDDDLSDVLSIRRQVFIEELGIKEDEEFDELDQDAMHVIVYEEDPEWKSNKDNKKAVATGRIIYDGDICQIGHIAVLKEYRDKKYGDFTVRMLLSKAFTSGIDEVYAMVQKSAIVFFEKIGFQSNEKAIINNDMEYNGMIIHSNDIIKQCNRQKNS